MKIVKQSAVLLWATPDAEKQIERAGRVCYKSEDKITEDSAGKFVAMLMSRGHEAMLEHASASFLLTTDRGVTHELVRHRIASFAQESTRYCNYGSKSGNITVIEPPFSESLARSMWEQEVGMAEQKYLGLLAMGEPPQIARSVLPTCLKADIVVTANFREWRHIIKLRTAKDAHPQIRELIGMVKETMKCIAPNVFGDL